MRSPRTHRVAARIAATAVIALAPLAVAAPAFAETTPSVASGEVTEVSRPGHGPGHHWNHQNRHHRGDLGVGWNRGPRHHPHHGWNRPGWHRPGWNHSPGWNHNPGWNHSPGWHRGPGLPFPRMFLPRTGSAY